MSSDMARGHLIAQALALLELGQSGLPMGVADVQAKLGCGRRTAYRWLREYRAIRRERLRVAA